MSNILDQIDNTLDDWHGSSDAMRWTPNAEQEKAERWRGVSPLHYTGVGLATREEVVAQTSAAMTRMAVQMVPVFRRFNEQLAEAFTRMAPLIIAMQAPAPESRPSVLDARYHQRQKNRRRR